MTLDEFQKRLMIQKNAQSQNLINSNLNINEMSEIVKKVQSNRIQGNSNIKKNLITNNPDIKAVLKAPVSKTLNQTIGIDPKNLPHKNTFGENVESGLWGALHLSKPIAKIGLTAINEATPYISNNTKNIDNIKNSFKNGDIIDGIKNTFKTGKDIILAPIDYISDKAYNGAIDTALNVISKKNNIDANVLKENVNKVYNEGNFNIVKQEKYGKVASADEVQKIVDEEYGKHIKNENVANVTSGISDMALEVSLASVGVPMAISSGVVGGLSTYGDTNDVKQIGASTARGVIFGALADGGGKIGESVLSKASQNYGKKYLATILGDAVTQGVTMPIASEVADRVSLRIIKGTWETTEEEERQINQSALIAGAIGILTSPLGSLSKVKKYKNSLPTVQNTGNIDSYSEAMKKLDEINYTLKNHTETMNNEVGMKKWANKKVSEILEGLDDNAIESLQKYFERGNPEWYSGSITNNVSSNIIQNSKNISSNATEKALAPIVNNKISTSNIKNNTIGNINGITSSNVSIIQKELIDSVNSLSALDVESKSVLIEAIKQTTSESLLNEYIPQINEMIELQKVVDNKVPTKTETIKGSFINYSKEKIDNNVVDNALNLIKSNNQGKRTKEQWLQVAEQIGLNAPSDKIDIYANKTWLDLKPNQKSTLNRQGKSYVPFSKDEWVNKVKEANRNDVSSTDIATQDRLKELKSIDISDMGLIEKTNIKREIRALEAGYTNVEDYLKAEELKKEQAKLEYEKIQKNKITNVNEDSNIDYRMQHRPTKNGVGYDITSTDSIGKDIYTNPENYVDMSLKHNQESYKALVDIRDNPNAEVTIYRASPKNELSEGDWITLSKTYAEMESQKENVPVNEFKVKAKDIQFAGDDINEFGYFPQENILNIPIKKIDIYNSDTLEGYDIITANRILSTNRDVIIEDEKQLRNLVDEALQTNSNKALHLGKISKENTEYIKNNINNLPKDKINIINKETYDLIINQSEIRHLIEDKPSLSNEDVLKYVKFVPKIITESDYISYSKIKDEGLRFRKEMEDGTYISFATTSSKGTLKVHNIHMDKNDYESKKRSLYPTNNGIKPLDKTSETNGLSASINNIIPSEQNYVNNSKNDENISPKIVSTKEDIDPLWEDLVKNSTEDAQEILKNNDLSIQQGRKNLKIISNNENIQVSNSGNIYPEGNKPTVDDFNKKGLENHFEKGDKRLTPIDKNNIEKGYKSETWIGNQWKDTDKIVESDLQPKSSTPFIDENGKTKTIDFISDNRKKDKISINELKDFMMQKFVNKGHYVDKLADNTNNPELKYAFDKTLSTYGEANYSIGVAQTNNNGKEIGKSIIDIFKPSKKANLYREFNDYLINRHNLDRQALGKAVYDESVTSEDSRRIIQAYEISHPEFKEWAEDVYTFNRNELHNLVEEGFISKELEENLHDIYGKYIPLHRDIIDIVNQSQESKNTGAVNPIKRAKGGSQNILNIEDAMAENVLKNKKAIRRNQLGKQLAKSTGNDKKLGDFGIDTSVFSPDAVMNISDNVGVQKVDGKYLYTVFIDGEIKQFKINNELYESLRADTIDMKIRNNKYADKLLSPVEKITKVQRDVLTTYSIGFALNNPIKDFQDGLFNSKYGSLKFISNYGRALKEIATNGEYYKDYMALGGNSNSYFEYGKGIRKESKNPISKVLKKVQDINEILETGPRLSEYISTIESGGSKNEAMYNASDITTNFKRGGEYTKLVNKYGANFLNASVQGLDKVIRTFTGKKTAKDWAKLFVNVSTLAVAPTLINYLIYKDDEEYQNLESYIKDEYYLIKTSDDGKFIRIPKGRILATISATARRIIEGATGGKFDVKGLGQEVKNQLAPNNPVKDNVFAPIMQVATNKAWYGGNIVPTRLENQLPKNQYDEKTDKISMWLGENLNISPIKINYLIDQYSGGIGDVILPMLTPKAENNIIVDKFTTDSIQKNKNVGEFYDNLDMYEKLKNDSEALEENTTKYNYLSKISTKVGKLYTQKRDIQMDNSLTDKEKQIYTREIQQEINMYCKNANNLINSEYTDEIKWQMYVDGILSDTIRDSDNSSILQDALYVINNGVATKKEYMNVYDKYKSQNSSIPTLKTLTQLKENNIKLKTYAEYDLVTKKYESDKDSSGKAIASSLTTKKVKYIYSMNASDKEKDGLLNILAGSDYSPNINDLKKLNGDYLTYLQQSGKVNDNKISAREKYMSFINANIPINQLNKYYNEIGKIEGQKDANGKTISGTKKQAVFNYVNSLSLNVAQKKLLLSTRYDSFKNEYYQDVFDYINSLKLTKEEKQKILKDIYD